MLGSRPLSRTTAFAPRRDSRREKPFHHHQERPALFVASPNHNPKLPILSISYLSRFPAFLVPLSCPTCPAFLSQTQTIEETISNHGEHREHGEGEHTRCSQGGRGNHAWGQTRSGDCDTGQPPACGDFRLLAISAGLSKEYRKRAVRHHKLDAPYRLPADLSPCSPSYVQIFEAAFPMPMDTDSR